MTMAFHLILAHLVTLALVVLTSASTSTPVLTTIAKHGCDDRCGKVSIPYPFGLTKECSLDTEDFLITCDRSFNPPRAFWGNTSIEVTEILLNGTLQITQFISKDCYDERGNTLNNNNPSLETGDNFRISSSKNKLTVIGCDTNANLDLHIDKNDKPYGTGCRSVCDSLDDVINGSCSGLGCCQISIPKDVWQINVSLGSYSNYANVVGIDRCSYAFVVKENYFNFTSNFLQDLRTIEKLPAVLDWTIGDEKCKTAETNKTSYACKENSRCNDDEAVNGPGYRCECWEGYQGNPYLTHGCQDIKECEYPSLNNCTHRCEEAEGSYTCRCPKGYNGDGRKDGHGCVADQSIVIKEVIGISLGVVLLVVSITWLYLVLQKRKLMKAKEKYFMENGGLILQQRLSGGGGPNSTTKIFTAEELKKATNNYDESRIIGQGGFGIVYKGYLTDKTEVAIKRSRIVAQRQTEQFINEVVVLSNINHRNVVRLLGCCLETQVPLLVYQFINNGTLFDHIHPKNKPSTLSWDIRLRIAAETAGVLSYFHSAALTRIIHRDIKSSNILLDDNYTAKVSDFGTSRLVGHDQTELSTLVQGTLGYLDPEYMQTGQLTEKSDVYSFGVVLVELFTGKKVVSGDRLENQSSLAMYFIASIKEDRLFEVIEDQLKVEGSIQQLKEVAMLAKRCLNVKGEDRPTMMEVAMELEGLRRMFHHAWVEDVLNLGDTESLLGETSDVSAYTYSTDKFDVTYGSSNIELGILPVKGGR